MLLLRTIHLLLTVFNDTLAHMEEVWDDPKFQQLMLGGIEWALGLVDADVKPGNSSPPAVK